MAGVSDCEREYTTGELAPLLVGGGTCGCGAGESAGKLLIMESCNCSSGFNGFLVCTFAFAAL